MILYDFNAESITNICVTLARNILVPSKPESITNFKFRRFITRFNDISKQNNKRQ